MGFKTDTIAAISTAMTNSGIGIVRLSGEDAFSIIDKIYKGKSPKLLSEQKSHTIHYGYIMDGEQTIDEVLVLLMRGPHSYTGEDTVEIDCHGGVFVTRLPAGAARRIHTPRISKRPDGPDAGRSRDRYHQLQE